jgi:MSHA biogenesis protein MshN
MSLINQVLQDLDRRHANGGAMPAAVRTMAPPVAHARPWRLAVIAGAVLLVSGGSAAIAWSMANRSAQPAAVHASTPATLAAPAPTQVVVVAASAPVAASNSALPAVAAMAMPAATTAPSGTGATPAGAVSPASPNTAAAPSTAAVKSEVASPQQKTARAIEPAEGADLAPAVVVLAPTAALKPSAPAAMVGESRIEKRTPGRTAHERAEAEYQRGVSLHQAGQYAEAAVAYTAALREESTLMAARQALAGALLNQGKSEDARVVLTDGLALAPQNIGLAMTLARLHVERGELQRAAEVLQPTDSASMSAEDHAFRAAVLQRIDRHAEASDHFAAALRTVPGNSVWWMGLGISQAADGHADHAKEAFNRARSAGGLTPELAQYVEQRLRQL